MKEKVQLIEQKNYLDVAAYHRYASYGLDKTRQS